MERQPADALKYSLLLRQANKEQYENEGNEGMRSGDLFHCQRKGSVTVLRGVRTCEVLIRFT